MLEIFTHSNLPHKFVFVTVHSSELANVSENIMKTVRQLEGVHVVKAILNVRIHDQLRQTQNLATQMER